MFEYTTQSGQLTIYEVFNGYQVRDNRPNRHKQVCGMGDGTNYVSGDDLDLPPAEAEKLKHDRMIDDVESSESDWLEAYFGGRQ
tara:strand:+ start:7513 stop:7764 length:252 start_codon:yes stop_codon:yes gene_type:complete